MKGAEPEVDVPIKMNHNATAAEKQLRTYAGASILRFPRGGFMGNKTAIRGAGKHRGAKRGESTATEKPVALTLKVDGGLYLRLSTLRATQRRTNQDILERALREYLTRAGA